MDAAVQPCVENEIFASICIASDLVLILFLCMTDELLLIIIISIIICIIVLHRNIREVFTKY